MSDAKPTTLPEPYQLRANDTLVSSPHTLADIFREELEPSERDLASFSDLEDLSLISVLGRGGMGVVYRALQKSLQREVAVKLLHPRLSQKAGQFEQFYKEVLLAASLSHPNIAHIHWVRRQDSLFYYVMEFIHGSSLAELLSTRYVGPSEVIHVFSQICAGLHHAHQRGIVHRDLKPGNILVESDEPSSPNGVSPSDSQHGQGGLGRAVLVDFGLAARPGEASVTREGMLMGTPAYMSPEQVRGDPTDHLSDIYSMGIALFEALTGRVPFAAVNPLAMAVKHLSDPVPDPRRLVPSLSDDLTELCLAMLSKEPDKRPQSCEEVRERLLSPLAAGLTTRTGAAHISGQTGLEMREVTILAVDLDGFVATAYDQAVARTSFMLEQWTELVEQAVRANQGVTVRREAALVVAAFNYLTRTTAHRMAAVLTLKDIARALDEFNHTHGRNQVFTAGLESGLVFIGAIGESSQPVCFGRPAEAAVGLARVRHCGLGLLGPAASQLLVQSVPLEPLIGVAEELGSATRIAPRFFDVAKAR